ncbi:hypothetical protein ACO1O0_006023 [Amphichorda felina]
MAHQAHNIPWTVLSSNLRWRLSNPCKNDATDFHLRFKPDQGKKLTYFAKAFERNIHDHAETERRKYPETYEPPQPDEVIVSDRVALMIAPTVRCWRAAHRQSTINIAKDTPVNALCHHMDTRQRCECAVPYVERTGRAFARQLKDSMCYQFFREETNAGAFLNAEIVKTLLLYGETDPILRVCSHPDVDLRRWWRLQECYDTDAYLGWDHIANIALDAYILLNVIYCFPETWGPTRTRDNDYRRARSYQSLIWRRIEANRTTEVVNYPHMQFFGVEYDQSRTTEVLQDIRASRKPRPQPPRGRAGLYWTEKAKTPFGHLPLEELLSALDVAHEPSPQDDSHVRRMLREKGLPVEVVDMILNMASYHGQRRLPVAHDPFHAENREELGKYLTYC